MEEKGHAHVIGLCGVGMSGTALLLKESGWDVTGSDAECYGPPREILKRGELDSVLRLSYDPSNIPDDVTMFMIGRNAKLSPEENAEVRAAHETGLPIKSFPEVLGELTKDRDNVVVVGSYGKSTTTSLIAHILRHAGVDAGYFIGAEPVPSKALPLPAKLGSAPSFVLEGDEYPSAHDDSRAKFLHLHPRDLVLTSVVHDHVNVYPTYESYQAPFEELLALVPEDGIIVACADEPGARAMAEASGKKVVLYGIQEGIYRASEIVYGERTTFTLLKDEYPVATLETSLLGRHNVEDIVAASAYVLARELVTPEALAGAVADFAGVRRRLDNIAPASQVPVFEGFGSSFEKARAAIDAILLHFATRQLVIMFEPHTFGWRNRANLTWYDTVFDGASAVFLAAPALQGANTHDQLSYDEIAQRIQDAGIRVEEYDSENVDAVVAKLAESDVVLLLTSGDFEGTLDSLAQKIQTRFPTS
ncbi:MAG: UDP-N-acetylmuramate--L-alanyl-gamma-D-glutamyl-meso-diaminopimelate ligase [Parcubacteria group bacterium]|nr:UDP-N-acetylmuramate--L-alanyl-gamma-D-glutamyl-meso-diaminopimelate ligase [Parcubacteria group bacterium]